MAVTPVAVVPNTPKSAAAVSSSRRPGSQVRVVVRVRPFLHSERASKDQLPCIALLESEGGDSQEVTVHIKDPDTSRNECYKLDSFYGQQSHPSEVFDREVFPLFPEIFHGYNATVFAYGATGSGKTFTMQGTDEQPGLMPLAMSTILSMCESTGSSVEISYFEIYMERCYDLLEPKAKEISVFENKDGRVQLKGLSQVRVSSISEFHEVFASGVQRRKVAHTNLNDVSSRSHGVLMIVVSSRGEGLNRRISGKLNLIDLAGNEDNKKTCNEGIRLQESATINQSLFALSKVICALNNNKPYVPYRDSKLTRILQDSLGGPSHSLMIACLNPVSYHEAIHTVSLAARSRQIVNHVSSDRKQESQKEKVDMEAKLRAWLESKGKTKSAQRIGTPFSPYLGRTPASSVNRPDLNFSSAKEKISDQEKLNLRGRKLFKSTAPNTTATKEALQNELHNPEYHFDNAPVDGSCFLKECGKEQSSQLKQAGRNEADIGQRDMKENMVTVHSSTFQYESQDKENVATPSSHDSVGFPSIKDRIEALKGSIRTVFSPMDSNTITPPREDFSPNDQFCVVKFRPRSPKTSYVAINSPMTGTPLDRFNSCASNLKNSLVEEYLEFLNTASKEDLQRLKGIGKKRADYILELREDSPYPLKSLSDLEKIGLSSKQVQDIFRKTIRGIFSKDGGL